MYTTAETFFWLILEWRKETFVLLLTFCAIAIGSSFFLHERKAWGSWAWGQCCLLFVTKHPIKLQKPKKLLEQTASFLESDKNNNMFSGSGSNFEFENGHSIGIQNDSGKRKSPNMKPKIVKSCQMLQVTQCSNSPNLSSQCMANGHAVTANKAVGHLCPKTGRRSWFDTPALASSTKIEIPIEKNRHRTKSCEEVEILVLSHFTSSPRIDFGKLKLGKQKARTLLIQNPHDYEQGVTIEKFPEKKKFSVMNKKFIVPPKATFPMEIVWAPEEVCCCREMILFIIDNVYRLQAYVFGSVEAPPKKKKIIGRKGLLSTKVKTLNVVQTSSLSSIKNAYTPSKAVNTSIAENYFNSKNAIVENENSENINPEQHKVETLIDMKGSPIKIENVEGDSRKVMSVIDLNNFRSEPPMNKLLDEKNNFENFKVNEVNNKQDGSNSVPSTPQIESPVSFISESREFQNKVKSSKEVLQSTAIASPSPKSMLIEKEKIEYPKTFLSPDTFLNELNASQSMSQSHRFRESGEMPSPTDVLNDSVPHNIMVKQLTSMKNSILDALSDSESGSAAISSQKKKFVSRKQGISTGPLHGRGKMGKNTGCVFPLKSSTTYTKFDQRPEKQFCPVQQKGKISQNFKTNKISLTSTKESALHAVRKKNGSTEASEHLSKKKIWTSLKSKLTKPDSTSLAKISTSCDSNKIQRQQKSLTVTKSKAPSTPNAESVSQIKKPLFACKLNKAKSEIVSEQGSQSLKNDSESKQTCQLQNDHSDEIGSLSDFVEQKLENIFKFEITTTPHIERVTSKETTELSYLCAVNSVVDSLPVSDVINTSLPDASNIDKSSLAFTPINARSEIVPKPGSQDLQDLQNYPLPQQTSQNYHHDEVGSLSDFVEQKLEDIFKFEITTTPHIERVISKETTKLSKSCAIDSLSVPEDINTSLPDASSMPLLDVNITPHQLPTSPRPDTSRRSTHLVDKRCSYLHKTMGQKRLFSPVPGHDYHPNDEFPDEVQQTATCESSNDSITNIKCSLNEQFSMNHSEELQISQKDPQDSCGVLRDNVINSKESPTDHEYLRKMSSLNKKVKCTEMKSDVPELENLSKSATCKPEQPRMKTSVRDVAQKTSGQGIRESVICTEQVKRISENRKRSSSGGEMIKVQKSAKRIKSDSSAVAKVKISKRRSVSDSTCPTETCTTSSTVSTKSVPPKKIPKVKKPVRGVPQAKLLLVKKKKTSLPKHPLPFAARNMYYDERWMDKQEAGFVQWLNFVLTPPEEYNQTKKVKVDANKLCLDGKMSLKLAPTKEVLSIRAYTARQRLNRLRRSACRLLQSEEIVKVIVRLEAEVESKRLVVRKDKMLHADLGIKQKVLDLILSYNPLWLRIGLETIYGEIIPLQNNNDVLGLSRFILTRLLGNPDIAQEYAHPTVPHLYRDGYGEALAGHTLKKYILLVFFLDKAKQKRLVDHDPCLFCKDSDIKSSKDLLVYFSRDYLSGEGDVTRHLAYFKLTVNHVQTALDEFNYAVTNLATDLRDGLRLTRVIELLTENWTLTKRLRVPVISRLQKVHNVEVVLKCLEERGLKLEDSKVNPRNIVDGHREKTLTLLWHMIFNFQVNLLIDEVVLSEEIAHLEKSLRAKVQLDAITKLNCEGSKGDTSDRRESVEADVLSDNKLVVLLMKWCRVVCAHYNIQVENFTVSFSDGRALCYLINHYHPSLLPRDSIQHNTTQTYQDQIADLNKTGNDSDLEEDSSPFQELETPTNFEELLSNERENIKLVHDKVSEIGGIPLMLKSTDVCNTIPDEKVIMTYVTYLCARLLDIRHESRAARIIQTAWRRHHLKKYKKEYEVKKKAAVVIQRVFRSFLNFKREKRMKSASLVIQAFWRGYRMRKMIRNIKNQEQLIKMEQAATVIQKWFKNILRRKNFKKMLQATIKIQACIRSYAVRKEFIEQQKAALHIQIWFRSLQQSKKCRSDYLQLKRSAVKIQSYFRAFRNRNSIRRDSAAVVIQSYWRMFSNRKEFLKKKQAVIVLQKNVRTKGVRRMFLAYKMSTIVIQRYFRAKKLSKTLQIDFLQKRIACILIQRAWRKYCNIKELRLKTSAVRIQSIWRVFYNRKKFLLMKAAAVTIQKNIRMIVNYQRYKTLKKSVVLIQKQFQANKLMKAEQICFMKMKIAALVIQKHYRGHRVRQHLLRQYAAALILQTRTRMILRRKAFQKIRQATLRIQTAIRSYQTMKQINADYTAKKSACIIIQKAWRKYSAEQIYKQNKSARMIQTNWRCYSAWKKYHRYRQAVITFQKNIKMIQTRNRFLKLKSAIVLIQRSVQAIALMKAERSIFTARKHAVIKLQKYFRGTKERRNFLSTKAATLLVQACYRRKITQERYRLLKSKAILIQQTYRSIKLSRSIQHHYNATKVACIIIQKKWRHFINKKKNRSAMLIQANWRCYDTRKKFLEFRQSALCIQRYVRTHLAKQYYSKLKASAIVLQRQFRLHLQRKNLREHVLHLNSAALVIQCRWRSHRDRNKFLNVKKSVVVMQKYTRCWIHLKNYNRLKNTVNIIKNRYRSKKVCKEYYTKKKAAIIIQSYFRSFKEQRTFSNIKANAVRIQSFWRMLRTRKRFLKLQAATVCIQNKVRATLKMKCKREYFIRRKRACIVIQSQYRMYKAAQKYKQLKKSVIKLQSVYRQYRAVQYFKNVKDKVLKIQRIVRATILCRKDCSNYLLLKSATVTLQKHIRGHQTRKMIKHWHLAALCIQKQYHLYQSNLCLLKQEYAAIVIQNMFRRIILQKSMEKWKHSVCLRNHLTNSREDINTVIERCHLMMHHETKEIYLNKSVFKKTVPDFVKCSKQTSEQMNVPSSQRNKRNGLISNHKITQNTKIPTKSLEVFQMQKAAMKSQERTFVEALGVKEQLNFTKLRTATICIQTSYRKYLQLKVAKRKRAAILIQASYKMYVVRHQYLQTLESAVKIQALVRTFIAAKRFKKIVQAITRIQQYYRKYSFNKSVRLNYSERIRAVCTIQAYYRGHQARQLCRQIKAVKKLQVSIRQYLHRRKIRKLVHSVVILQSRVRGFLARREYKKLCQKHYAAICIQSHVRGFTARMKYKEHCEKHQAATCIQKFYKQCREKMYLKRKEKERRLFLEQLMSENFNKVILIQSVLRAFIQRRRYLKQITAIKLIQKQFKARREQRDKAARRIQCSFRKWMRMQKLKKLIKYAVVIQAAWRGYKLRRDSRSKRLSDIRRRLSVVNKSATDENTLGYRTRSALDYLLKYKQLSYILEALVQLDVSTRLSPKCCESMVRVNAVQVIYKLIRSCNRSLPHMELIKYSVNILLNLTKYEKTASAVYEVEGSIVTLLDLMQIYREKGAIFTKTCTLLGILGTDDTIQENISSDKRVVERLQSFYSLTLRKHKIDERNKIKKARLSASQSFNSSVFFNSSMISSAKRPIKIQPEWAMRRDSVHELDDPMIAINFVMNNLHITPK